MSSNREVAMLLERIRLEQQSQFEILFAGVAPRKYTIDDIRHTVKTIEADAKNTVENSYR